MNLIKLLDVANPKKVKSTINELIQDYTNFKVSVDSTVTTATTDADNALANSIEALGIAQANSIESGEAKQIAEEALTIAETAENTATETIAVAEQAAADADDAVDTAELALNTANAARSAVDQALDLGQLGSFVHNTSGIALAHAYMTDNINQTDDIVLDRYHIATPKLVRDTLNNYYNKSEIDAAFEANRNRNTYSITLTHNIPFSDPDQPFLAVKFLTIDCSTFDQYIFIKLSARSFKNTNLSTSANYNHAGYFCEDIYIYKRKGIQPFVDIYNYAHDIDFFVGFGDGKSYAFGDIFWTVNNNVYTFYMICRDSSSTQFTPFTIIETSSASNTDLSTTITQYSGTAEYYTTGQRWNRSVGSDTYNNKVVTYNDLNYYVDQQSAQTIAGQKTFADSVIFNNTTTHNAATTCNAAMTINSTLEATAIGNTLKQVLVDYFLPVGSYYITESENLNNADKMHDHFGGTWTPVSEGRFIEATTTANTGGGKRDAGLPNITGSVYNSWGLVQTRDNSNNGALSWGVSSRTSRYDGNYYNGDAITSINFNASSSNNIYGKSSTVQPKSRRAYIYYRTA